MYNRNTAKQKVTKSEKYTQNTNEIGRRGKRRRNVIEKKNIQYKDIIAKHATYTRITNAFASKFHIIYSKIAHSAFTNNTTKRKTTQNNHILLSNNVEMPTVQSVFDCF